jgi:hypothetical protein
MPPSSAVMLGAAVFGAATAACGGSGSLDESKARRVPAEGLPSPEATPRSRTRARRVGATGGWRERRRARDLAILEPAGLAFAITLKTDEPARFSNERVEPHPEAR